MTEILMPALYLGGIALLLGAVLAVAAVIFKTDRDDRIPAVEECLPGANCGGCGYAGCSAYAAAIVNNEELPNLCAVGGMAAAEAIGQIMGVDPGKMVPKTAVVACRGTCEVTTPKFDYSGMQTCAAANAVGGGPKDCTYGCLGFGSCVAVCVYHAISLQNNVAVVDSTRCRGCGTCANACPRKIIVMRPLTQRAYIPCSSADKGALARKNCTAACIGCGLCAKICPKNAVTTDGHLAKIDAAICDGCGICAEKCPQHCIVVLPTSS